MRCMIWLAGLVLIVLTGPGASAGQSISEIYNFHKYSPQLMSAGQPSEDQLTDLKDAGVDIVINLIPSSFRGSIENEAQLVARAGLEYFYIPVSWREPSMDDIEAFFKIMDRVKGKRVLVHCAFNARASAFAYLYRVIRQSGDREIELETMNTIWKNNKGYSLPEVPHWSQFLNRVLAAEQRL